MSELRTEAQVREFPVDRIRRRRRESWIALNLGLPWGWRVRVVGGRLHAAGRKPLACGHRTISTLVRDGDLVAAAAKLAHSVRFHLSGG